MKVRSSGPYWLYHTPALHSYTQLDTNLKTQVAVVGAGISGALAAYALINAGYEVTIVTKSHVGFDSTCASTSFLQYEIDTPLYKLADLVGEKNAARSYMLCHYSIEALARIHKAIGTGRVFERRKSLLLASYKKDITGLSCEYEARKQLGLQVEWLTGHDIEKYFGFYAPAAIYSKQGAQTDVYLFTQELIAWCAKHGARVYDKTGIKNIYHKKRSVELYTENGYTITAGHVVMAPGYQAVNWIDKRVATLYSTYSIISEPFDKKELWKDECLMWETKFPYTYMRACSDGRVIVGGKDVLFKNVDARDALINKKSKQLVAAFNQKFPHLKYKPDYKWAGTFAQTKDGLPYIGTIAKWPRVYFALGYGGNGITFSQIAADIICDLISGKKNNDANLFGFARTIQA